MDVTAEISGPVLAAFQHRFGESPADFLAILLGNISVHNYSENSDMATQTEKSKVRVVVQDWIIVSMEEVMDFKSGKLNRESLQSLVKGKSDVKFVGMMKFKKSSPVDLSFLDRKMMASVLDSCSQSDPRPHLYILVGEEVTSTLSIKYNMSTYLLEHKKSCFLGPWSSLIPLVVPNLGTDQRVEYMQGMGGGSKALREMVEGTGLVEACHIDVDKNFQPLNAKFKDGMEHFSDRVSQLEVTKCTLEEEVLVMKRQVEDRLMLSREMKLIKGLQGDLKTALDIITDEFDFNNKASDNDFKNKVSDNDSRDMFGEDVSINRDEEMETESEVLGVLDQSY